MPFQTYLVCFLGRKLGKHIRLACNVVRVYLASLYSSTMNVKAALDALCVSPKAYLLLDPALQVHPVIQDFVFGKRPDLALEVVGLDDKRLESLLVRAIRKGLTLKEVVHKRPEFASNLPCILAALSHNPFEMRFAQLRVAASKLDDQQKLRLRNKVQESVSRNGETLQYAEQFRGDAMVVLAACAQDVRHAALAMEPLGTWLCSIAASDPSNLTKIANHLVNNRLSKRTYDGNSKLAVPFINGLSARATHDQHPKHYGKQAEQQVEQQVVKPDKEQQLGLSSKEQFDQFGRKDTKASQDDTKLSRDDTKPSQEDTMASQEDTKPCEDDTTPSRDDTTPNRDDTKPERQQQVT